jgi:NADP-dependent 3-hydroxy acid dehydrogenase YdfG
MTERKVILVTGASSGFGLLTARLFQEKGWRVFGTTRALDSPPAGERFEWIGMDVRSDESVRSGVAAVIGRAGRIDALFNNAGIAMLGAVEETSLPEAKQLFETNVFGVLRVTQAVLPAMRAQGGGCIVMMSSLSGRFGVPFHGVYAASKQSVEAMAQALRFEVEPHGIRVGVIEPEAHRTGIRMVKPGQPLEAYDRARSGLGALIERQIESGPAPERVANLVYRLVASVAVPYRHPTGRKAAFFCLLIGWLPDAWMHWIARRVFRLERKA